MLNGPRKLVLIRAGRYEYAEVELEGSLQIVGKNNTGKTTLIKTLQFLYIEEWRKMDFGTYDIGQTRSYYFPDEYSYVLFECLGEQGKFVLGWRGQSKLSGAEPTRFMFSGEFEQEDFFEDERVREPKKVSERLARRDEFRTMTNAEHRGLLLPKSREYPHGQGLVPIKDAGRYPHFRETLKNLLTLTDLTQEQMRDRLLMLAGYSASAVALDIRELLREDYDRKREERRSLTQFKKAASELRQLVEQFQKRTKLRGELMTRWRDISDGLIPFQKAHEATMSEWKNKIEAATETLSNLEAEINSYEKEKTDCSIRLGGWRSKLKEVEEEEAKFEGFLEEFERSAYALLLDEVASLEKLLREAESGDGNRVELRLTDRRRQRAQKLEAAENFERLLITKLRPNFSDHELTILFQILNFDFLEMPIGADGIKIHNETNLCAFLREVLNGVREGAYQDSRVTIRLREPERRAETIANPDELRIQAAELGRQINEDEKLLEAIREREKLQTTLGAKKAERDTKGSLLAKFDVYKEHVAQRQSWVVGDEEESQKLEEWSGKIGQLRGELGEIKSAQQAAEKGQQDERDEYNRIQRELNSCERPFFEKTALSPVMDIPPNFDSAIAYYKSEWRRAEGLDTEVKGLFDKVEQHLGSEFREIDDTSTVDKLTQELEALPEREEALDRDWRALIQGMKRTFADILKDIESIKVTANDLNREFSRLQISNLRAVGVKVMEQADLVERIKGLSRIDELNLFGDLDQLDETIESFRKALEVRPVVQLSHLFSLGFAVTGSDRKMKVHTDFRQIESDGTTITLKVVFSLLVLRSLLKENRAVVPFFLDEIEALDPANRSAVLTLARKLGFIAITAAPGDVSEVDTLWFLEPDQDRATLTSLNRVDIRRKDPVGESS